MTALSHSLKIGILSTAHLHCSSYVSCFSDRNDAKVVGVWDDDPERGRGFAEPLGLPFFESLEAILDRCDAVVITSENTRHVALVAAAAAKGRHVICEKPLVARIEECEALREAVHQSGIQFMTAFPCRFSPAFERLKKRIQHGEIGRIRAISATNRGTCPFSWFVDPSLSGGGAMIDHVVHVTDLLRNLLGEEVTTVQAQVGNNTYGQSWEDTAMLTLEFPSGIFATLDSSWSRPKNYKTWGDVTLTVTGDLGVMELDLFGAGVDVYRTDGNSYQMGAYGSNLDAAMVEEFVLSILHQRPPAVTMEDGIRAAEVALAGYRSAASGHVEPVA